MAIRMKDAHKEALCILREINAVEAALQQMLVEAIDSIYIKAIRDRATNSINFYDFLTSYNTCMTPTAILHQKYSSKKEKI